MSHTSVVLKLDYDALYDALQERLTPLPSSRLGEQPEPGWRTAADMQRIEAWRAETKDRREGIGSPDALRTSVN